MDSAQETAALDLGDAGRSLTDRIYRALKEDILASRLGSEPMVETAIARKYGYRRRPVREALRQLTHEGLVIVLPRKGYIVRPMGVSDIRGGHGFASHSLSRRWLPLRREIGVRHDWSRWNDYARRRSP